MKTTMIRVFAIAAVIAGFGSIIYSQSAMPGGRYVNADEIAAAMASALAERPTFGVSRIDAGDDFAVNLIRRTVPAGAIIHADATEYHYITEGAGVLVTGGASVRPDGGGPANIEGGHAQRVSVGDTVVIPQGTPHQYTSVEGGVTYLEVRFQTSKYSATSN
jgi:mannose-6-phosphate isomerase-like protein (cupin superfamily)